MHNTELKNNCNAKEKLRNLHDDDLKTDVLNIDMVWQSMLEKRFIKTWISIYNVNDKRFRNSCFAHTGSNGLTINVFYTCIHEKCRNCHLAYII